MSFRPAYAISALGLMGGAAGAYYMPGKDRITKYGTPRTSQIQVKQGYISETDFARKQPKWVLQYLTRETLNPPRPALRKNVVFDNDYDIPALFQAHDCDYAESSFTRGHMAPAADNSSSIQSMQDTFRFNSNIVPQDANNNSEYWEALERWTRNLVLERNFTSVRVLSGPLYPPMRIIKPNDFKAIDFRRTAKKLSIQDSNIAVESIGDTNAGYLQKLNPRKPLGIVEHPTIGENHVHVPPFLFKAVLGKVKGSPVQHFAAFVVPNAPIPHNYSLQDFQVTHDELQRISGIEFFQGAFQNATMPPRDLCKLSVRSGRAEIPICQLANEFGQNKILK